MNAGCGSSDYQERDSTQMQKTFALSWFPTEQSRMVFVVAPTPIDDYMGASKNTFKKKNSFQLPTE